jgi:hypothetical protein
VNTLVAVQLKSLSTALDGPVAHLLHHFLVQDALCTLFTRAQMHSDAIQQNWLMDVSYENHLAKHPELHVCAPDLERDLNPCIGNMPQAFLKHALVQDGRMNSYVMQSYLFGTRVRAQVSSKVQRVHFTVRMLPCVTTHSDMCLRRNLNFV